MQKNKSIYVIIWFIVILLFYHGYNKAARVLYGTESVAKLHKIKSTGKTYYVEYIYFVNDEKYVSENQMGFKKRGNVGDYYKIIYSSKNPKNVEIFLDERITDTVLIRNAGFNKNGNVSD
jgi:hypothetical protein